MGCHYCPSDGTCYNSNTYNFTPKSQSCVTPESYLVGGNVCSLSPDDDFFTDPLYEAQQWVYDMIRIVPVWTKGYSGKGIRVRINDNGVDGTHDEFERFNITASCEAALPRDVDTDGHGTAVASIIGAASNNGLCAAGIAPNVSTSSCNVFTNTMLFLSEKLDSFDISQNSWGLPACGNGISTRRTMRGLQTPVNETRCPFQSKVVGEEYDDPCDVCNFEGTEPISLACEAAIITHCTIERQYENDEAACLNFLDLLVNEGDCSYDKVPVVVSDALSTGILEGRNGKGIIYVFSSGDGFSSGDDVNFSGLTNSRFVVTVGGVGKDGLHASYSTPGAALFVSAPGGDYDAVSNHMVAAIGGGCNGTLPGTSFAAAVVSGVIALILEANGDLTWRDVQGILATTSQPVVDQDDTSAIINAAGLWHSNYYGFGIIDAESAVNASEKWPLYSTERNIVGTSIDQNMTIPDDASKVVISTVSIPKEGNEDFIVESASVFLQLEHFSRGDLEVTLESPSGTLSVLHPGKRIENTQQRPDDRWKLLTLRNWGESGYGNWTLRVRDMHAGDVSDCADAPFYVVLDDDQEVTCDQAESEEWCSNGTRSEDTIANATFDSFFAAQENGLTIEQACCRCGGGLSSTDVKNVLVEWRLFLYGHGNEEEFVTPDASLSPGDPTLSPGDPTLSPSTTGVRPSDPPSPPSRSSAPSAPSSSIDTETDSEPSPPVSNQVQGGTDQAKKQSTTEMVIMIVSIVVVSLFVIAAVKWTCNSPQPSARFQPVDRTSDII